MLTFDLLDVYWFFVVIIVVWSLIFGILFFLNRYFLKERQSTIAYFYGISISFSFLGLSIGLLVGLSKSPVVAVVIPALLTFYGGFLSYFFLFGKVENKVENGLMVILILISISFFLILGTDYGASIREEAQQEEKRLDHLYTKDLEEFKALLQGKYNESGFSIALPDQALEDTIRSELQDESNAALDSTKNGSKKSEISKKEQFKN